MATKTPLKPAMKKKLADIGITGVETEEQAIKKMSDICAKNDVDINVKDPIEEIFEMTEVFYDPNEEVEEEAEAEEEEVVTVKKKTSGKKAVEPEEEEEEEEEEVVVAKKPAKKVVVKETEEEEEKPAKKGEKKKAPAAKKEKGERGSKFDPLNNDEHDALLNPLRTVFKDTKKYEVQPLYNGVSVFILAKNSKIIIFSLKNGTVVKGDVQGVLWNNRFKAKEVEAFHEIVAEDFLGDTVKIGTHSTDPLVTIRRITIKQWVKILKETGLLSANVEQVEGLDKKMGKNREKLEASLKSGKASKDDVKKVAGKKPVVAKIEEEEEEEEEEVAKPTKKVVAKKPAPKVVAKKTAKK